MRELTEIDTIAEKLVHLLQEITLNITIWATGGTHALTLSHFHLLLWLSALSCNNQLLLLWLSATATSTGRHHLVSTSRHHLVSTSRHHLVVHLLRNIT